jgi:hypothetical protein
MRHIIIITHIQSLSALLNFLRNSETIIKFQRISLVEKISIFDFCFLQIPLKCIRFALNANLHAIRINVSQVDAAIRDFFDDMEHSSNPKHDTTRSLKCENTLKSSSSRSHFEPGLSHG